MDGELQALWIEQYYKELDNEKIYALMATIAMAEELDGFCKLFREQAHEEHEHAIRIFDYLLERRVVIIKTKKSEEIEISYITMDKLLDMAYKKEMDNTKFIRIIYGVANAKKDYMSIPILDWFIKEQNEEENKFRNLIQKLEMLDSPYHINEMLKGNK